MFNKVITKCDMICDGIKDEQEGQNFYRKLYNKLKNDPVQSGMAFEAHNDEEKHERYLKIMKKRNRCKCDI